MKKSSFRERITPSGELSTTIWSLGATTSKHLAAGGLVAPLTSLEYEKDVRRLVRDGRCETKGWVRRVDLWSLCPVRRVLVSSVGQHQSACLTVAELHKY